MDRSEGVADPSRAVELSSGEVNRPFDRGPASRPRRHRSQRKSRRLFDRRRGPFDGHRATLSSQIRHKSKGRRPFEALDSYSSPIHIVLPRSRELVRSGVRASPWPSRDAAGRSAPRRRCPRPFSRRWQPPPPPLGAGHEQSQRQRLVGLMNLQILPDGSVIAGRLLLFYRSNCRFRNVQHSGNRGRQAFRRGIHPKGSVIEVKPLHSNGDQFIRRCSESAIVLSMRRAPPSGRGDSGGPNPC
jgi:hypothetical protein